MAKKAELHYNGKKYDWCATKTDSKTKKMKKFAMCDYSK